jgi:hypothetical protein
MAAPAPYIIASSRKRITKSQEEKDYANLVSTASI